MESTERTDAVPRTHSTRRPSPTRTRAGAGDNPDAYIAGDRRRALGAGIELPDRVRGAALFCDISGFTPLTEALAAEFGPQRGAEELTAALNVVFDAVLGQLHRYGGSVIYFSGDAVTCWIDGDDGLLAVSCALAMQSAMARVGTVGTPGGKTVELGMKVAVAAGPARRFVVGEPDIQLIDVLAGALMDRLAEAEHHAERGEVVIDGATADALSGRVEIAAWRGDLDARVGVVSSVRAAVDAAPAPQAPYPRLPRAVVRQWLLPAVYDRMRHGRGEFLAELRPAVPVFVRFGGIDYDADEDAPRLLDDFVRRAQRVVDAYGGNLLQLTIGDKGAYLYAVFGSPLAHEDDAARACAASLDLLALESETAATGIQVGIAAGRLRSGTYGHRQRRTFCCLGDAVNVAARLMSAAPAGSVYVSPGVARAAGTAIAFEEVGSLRLKGKVKPVVVRRVAGRTGRGRTGVGRADTGALQPLLGRDAELARLLAAADLAAAGRGQVVAVVAEAGMGKTRLAEELAAHLSDRGVRVHAGAAASVGAAASYFAWHPVAESLLGLAPGGGGPADLLRSVEEALGALDPALVPRAPLLGAVLGTALPDNDLTAGFEPKLRKTSLESLVVQFLTCLAQRGPVAIVLEDCHWIDQLSADLLELVSRSVAVLPVLVVLNYRPGSFHAPALGHTGVVELDRLDDPSCRSLLTARLAERYGAGVAVSDAVADLLVSRAEGNPFYVQELADYLFDRGADPQDPEAAAADLPSSLSQLVLSRIDTLVEAARRTLKVASVVGREFGAGILSGAYPELGVPRRVAGNLAILCDEHLVVADEPAADLYAFRHAVIRDVAYESLPFALRSLVHGRVGRWLESSDPGALDLLAHHFWHSDEEDKKREYLWRAGEAARDRYANDAAVDYLRRLAPLVEGAERERVLQGLGGVLEIRGDWSEATDVYRELLALAEGRGDTAAVAWAHVACSEPMQKQGRLTEAALELDAAEHLFDTIGERAGIGRVEHVRGLVANRSGQADEAWGHFERSLEIRRELGDRVNEATTLGNLAVAAANRGDYDLAWDLTEQSLVLRAELGDRRNTSVSQNNLGMIAYLRKEYSRAVPHLEDAVRNAVEIGALLTAAIARHTLGNCARELGDGPRAGANYAEALRAYGIADDRYSLAQLWEDVAMLAVQDRPTDAFRLVGAADALREATGAQRVDFEEAALDEHVGAAAQRLGEEAVLARTEGRGLDLPAASDLAAGLCLAAA